MEIQLEIIKKDVYDEVAKTTNYTGAKMRKTDEDALNRISTVDEDASMLERFWQESKNLVAGQLKKVLAEEKEDDGNYHLKLTLSSSFDNTLKESMQRSLFSFFVLNITSKWYTFTNKPEATGYASEAASNLEDVMRKAYYKKRPMRPSYQQNS